MKLQKRKERQVEILTETERSFRKICSACVTYVLSMMISCAVCSKITFHWLNLYYALSQISKI